MNKLPPKSEPKIIKLSKFFSITWDSRQWVLMDYTPTAKDQEIRKTPKQTYHGKLNQVLGEVIERQLGDTEGGLQKLLDKYDLLISKMEYCANSMAKQLN